ncbi:MAG TPA: AsmA family protein [Methylophilaceae bacterium]|nr:AsmA family protein [Methylophilaceae bacterium]
MTTTTNKAGFSKLLLRLIAVVLMALVLVIAIGEIMGWPFLRQPAEKFASKQLERQIRLQAPFKLRLIGGLKLEVGGLWIGAPEGFDAPYFLDANDVMLKLRYRDLWSLDKTSAYRVQALKVYALDARAIRHQDGHSTWQFKQDESTPPRPFPIIESLLVANGQALVQDALTQADLKISFNTEEGANDTQATSHVDAKGEFRGRAIQGAIKTSGFLPVATQTKDAPPLSSKGWVEYGKVRVDFDGTVSDLLGDQNIKGKLAIKGPSLAMLGDLVNVTLPTTEAFSLSGLIEKKDEVWNTRIDRAHVGSSELSGNFKYDARLETPLLSGELKGKRFMLADLAPAFGTKNEDGSTAKPKDGKAIPDRPLDLPSLNKMDANIKINLEYVDLGSAFSQPISPLKADLTIDHGNMSLAKIDARTAQGSISGLIAVDAQQPPDVVDSTVDGKETTKTPPKIAPKITQWKIDLAWKNIDLEKWLQVSKNRQDDAKNKGKSTVPPAYVTGTLNGKTRLTGQGQSTAKLLSSLDGDVSMFIHKGSLSHLIIEVLGLDVAQAIGVLVTGDQSLPMECAVMDLKAKDGIITPNVALVDTPVTMILIDGDINMATENLNLRLSAKPKNFSPLTLRSPIRVTGPFTSPKVSPEAGPIAAKAIASVALAFINPLAAILPLIDTGDAPEDKLGAACSQSLANLEKAQHSNNARLNKQKESNPKVH